MGFEEFKNKIVEGLQEIYGEDAQIKIGIALKNNGSKYNGINIFLKGSGLGDLVLRPCYIFRERR